MFENNFSSQLLSEAVSEFSKLPGIGKKTALRLVLHLLKQPINNVELFSSSILKLKQEVKFCIICSNISDRETCSICSNSLREHNIICIVENIQDIIAIENTQQYRGVYHVLGGIISPIDGIGPNDLNITQLTERIIKNKPEEIIFALNTTMEGDTTCFYLYKILSKYNINISTIARGVAFGGELEYTDEITLGRSILKRSEYETNM